MSTPQLEDGFVRIANALMEAILAGGFSQRELLVLLTIMRKTYGFQKTEDDMSASQIGDMCNLARPHVTAVLNQLAQRNVISKRAGRFGSIVGIQKDVRKWISSEQFAHVSARTESIYGSTESVHVPNRYSGSTESVQVDSTESVHTKDNLPKDNQQKTSSCAPVDVEQAEEPTEQSGTTGPAKPKRRVDDQLQERFDRFYAAYPKKRSPRDAERAFKKLSPDDATVDAMLDAIARLKASGEWTDPQYIPYPASWLNAGGWLDVVQTAYSADEAEVIEVFNELLGDQLGRVSATAFDSTRAALIREFLTFNDKPELARRFFGWFSKTSEAPPRAGMDWLISRRVYADACEGKYTRKAA